MVYKQRDLLWSDSVKLTFYTLQRQCLALQRKTRPPSDYFVNLEFPRKTIFAYE